MRHFCPSDLQQEPLKTGGSLVLEGQCKTVGQHLMSFGFNIKTINGLKDETVPTTAALPNAANKHAAVGGRRG
jgi:hypothetical protein